MKQRILTLIAIALTFASGATDVASFTRLGDVFTSVMTGNIVLLGLSVARESLTLASHSLVSIAGYIIGVAGGTWIAHGFRVAGAAGGGGAGAAEADGQDEGRASGLPAHVGWALLAELILLSGFTAGWEISGAKPEGWAQFGLLAVASAAMGVQSSTVKDMGLSDVGTTYLTGTLTGLVSSLVSPGHAMQYGGRRFGVLIGLAAGAALSGLLIATAADAMPALPLAALMTSLVLASAPRSWWAGRPGAQRAGEAQPGEAEPGEAEPGEAEPGEAEPEPGGR